MIDKILSKLAHFYFTSKALPYWMVLMIDCSIVVVSGIVASVLYKGAMFTINNFCDILVALLCFLLFYLIGFRVSRTYSGVMRYSSFNDLIRVAFANAIGIALIFCLRHITAVDELLYAIPAEQLIISFIIATFAMWAIRICIKYLYDIYFVNASKQKVFIYGTKEGGIALAKSIHSEKSSFVVTGFVSDDKSQSQHTLLGCSIYHNNDKLVQTMVEKDIKALLVSPLMTESLRNNQKMIDALTDAHIKIMLYSHQEWNGKDNLKHTHLKEVDIEDLLPRNQIEVDLHKIEEVLKGKCVLITGAAGSIGSEIVRQVASFAPSQMVLVDQAETPLHDIMLMMNREFADIPCDCVTASIVHIKHMEHIFSKYKPEYVFHAAAYKHVPMMEDNPGEAVMNNIEGTRIVADLAVKYGTKKFVMVSTDKAVNPTNVMGCSKRICEMYCQSLDKLLKVQNGEQKTQFVTTRFGNVLGSNGSVIPLFKEQIKAGGPLTVTHPDIIRYFMLIPEACKLVLQAGTMGNGGEIFVFDMGKPVRIADLAKRMIQLSGATDVEIKYTGLRFGEKLYEELLNKEENTKPSTNPKIKLATVRELDYKEVSREIDRLVEITLSGYNDMDIVRQMKGLVPEFKSKNSKYEILD